MTAQHVSINRDPFARCDLVRRIVRPSDRRECAWCGQPARFEYAYWLDGIYTRPAWDGRQYCSVGCYRDANS